MTCPRSIAPPTPPPSTKFPVTALLKTFLPPLAPSPSRTRISVTFTLSVTGNASASYTPNGGSSGAVPTNSAVNISTLIASGAISFDQSGLTSDGGQQTIDWTYDPDAADLDWLQDGDTLTLTYTAQITDGAGNVGSQNLVININGTNDAPTLSDQLQLSPPSTRTPPSQQTTPAEISSRLSSPVRLMSTPVPSMASPSLPSTPLTAPSTTQPMTAAHGPLSVRSLTTTHSFLPIIPTPESPLFPIPITTALPQISSPSALGIKHPAPLETKLIPPQMAARPLSLPPRTPSISPSTPLTPRLHHPMMQSRSSKTQQQR